MTWTRPHIRLPRVSMGGIAGRTFAATVLTVATGMIVDNADWPDWLLALMAGSAAEFPVPESPAPGEELVSFTVFRTLPYKSFTVTTGWRYGRFREAPTGQYCYAEHPQGEANTWIVLMLAGADETAEVVYRTISDRDADPFGVSAEELAAVARSYCRFTAGQSSASPSQASPRGDEGHA